MRQRQFLLLLFILAAMRMWCADGDTFSDSIRYVREVSEPITWSPESSVLYGQARISLFTEYGKIFYLVNDTLGNAEPAEYRDGIMLRGQAGKVTDYNVTALLERDDGRLEIYSRQYRIDRTDTGKMRYFPTSVPFDRQIGFGKDKEGRTTIDVRYIFADNKFAADIRSRQVTFPLTLKPHKTNEHKQSVTLPKGRNPVYMSFIRYNAMTQNNAVIECLTEQMAKTRPPQFGSLQWGQTFSEDTAIRIKPSSSEDKIYYWIRDFSENDFIFAPPPQDDTESWMPYSTPITLRSIYRNGTIGIAAYSVGPNGIASDIAGPFYLKVTGDAVDTRQLFKTESKPYKRRITLNGHDLHEYAILFDKVRLEFSDFPANERYYFTFNDGDSIGRSGYIPCEGQYIFENVGTHPLDLMLYNDSGSQIGRIAIIGSKMTMPSPRDFAGTETHLDASSNVVFYLPQNVIRYAASVNDNRPLTVTEDSPIFRGIFRADETDGQTNIYRILFASFDSDGNKTAQSDLYTITVDRRNPASSVVCSGTDLSIYHNETQTLTLLPNAANHNEDKIYYRMSQDLEWQPYSAPITLTPPDTGVHSVSIYAKSVSPAGIESVNDIPFVVHFDRRSLFVDCTLQQCGNGTQKSPYNTLDAAIATAKTKNIKLINIINESSDCFVPYKIDSDVIIQPGNADTKVTLNLKNRAIGRKNLIWFNVSNHGLLEMRNIRLIIDGCSKIFAADNSKIKLYNNDIIYNGSQTFAVADGRQSMIGISTMHLDAFNLEQDFNGISADKCQLFINALDTTVTGQNISVLNISDCRSVTLSDSTFNVSSDGNFTFAGLNKCGITIDNTSVTAIGGLRTSALFNAKNSDIAISHGTFSVSGSQTFKSVGMSADKSSVSSEHCSILLENTANAVGFDIQTGDLIFSRSLLDIRRCSEYAYGFRVHNGSLSLNSSITRNQDCDSSINFSLTNAPFTGINNSVFNCGSPTGSFCFWVTNKADITSINSFYRCSSSSESTFLYLNNSKSAEIKPLLDSNVLSDGMILMQRYDGRNTDTFADTFADKNIFYGFESDFDLDNDTDFYVPARDSALLQAGTDSSASPLPLPETDYYGRLRNHHRSGIDIGAVQRSGYF